MSGSESSRTCVEQYGVFQAIANIDDKGRGPDKKGNGNYDQGDLGLVPYISHIKTKSRG